MSQGSGGMMAGGARHPRTGGDADHAVEKKKKGRKGSTNWESMRGHRAKGFDDGTGRGEERKKERK